MTGTFGTNFYLRKMAERFRRAAQERSGEDALYLMALAEGCERRLAERERAAALVASEED
jgi:hypothetical protein